MAAPTIAAGAPAHHKPWYKHLYAQVLCAIVLGVLLGHFFPAIGAQMKPLGDAFIKLIKMLIAPIIFCTVVHGIASMEDMKKVGRVGFKALLYFGGSHRGTPQPPKECSDTEMPQKEGRPTALASPRGTGVRHPESESSHRDRPSARVSFPLSVQGPMPPAGFARTSVQA